MHGEKTIVAYFSDSEAAYKAVRILQQEGLGSASVQQVFHNSAEPEPGYKNPLEETRSTARYGAVSDLNNSFLEAGPGNYNAPASEFLLTLSVTRDKADHAVSIISNYGGTF